MGPPVVERLSLKPSEYFARQCNIGASFIRPHEVLLRHEVGVNKIMWGSDYPHKEASHPYSHEALRAAFAGVPTDEVAQMVGGNAAKLYGFDVDALRPVAAEWGPTGRRHRRAPRPGRAAPAALKCPAFAGMANVKP